MVQSVHSTCDLEVLFNDSFVLKPDELHKTIINLEYIGVGKFGEKVLDHLWRISFRFVPDAILGLYQLSKYGKKHIPYKQDKLEDWRNVVKTYVNELPSDKKDWSRTVTDKY